MGRANSIVECLLPRTRLGTLLMLSLTVLSLTTGCSMGGGYQRAPEAAVPTGAALVEKAEHEPAGNPYLQNRSPVSADALNRFSFSAQAMSQSSWEIAEQGLSSLVVDYPQLSGPCLNLALVYQHGNELQQAEYWFKQSIARNANNLLAYNQYAIFLREQGRFEQAEKTYLKALSVWEPHAETHRNLGILYDLYRGNKKGALQHYSRYQALQNEQDRIVAGWIADLQRQLSAVAGVQ